MQELIFKIIITVFLTYIGLSYHRSVLLYLRLQLIMLLLVGHLMSRKVDVKFSKRLADEQMRYTYNYINTYLGQNRNIESMSMNPCIVILI